MRYELEVFQQQEELEVVLLLPIYLIHLIRNIAPMSYEEKVSQSILRADMLVEVVSQFMLVTPFQWQEILLEDAPDQYELLNIAAEIGPIIDLSLDSYGLAPSVLLTLNYLPFLLYR